MYTGINRNLTVVNSSQFEGLSILGLENGFYAEYLQRNYEVMNHVLKKYSKVFAVRVDLHIPEGAKRMDTAVITRFMDSLKAQLKSDYLSKSRSSEGQVHASDVFYIWVKEVSNTGRDHYHICLFFNGHAYRCLGLYQLGRNNLYNRIHKAWASATETLINLVPGSIHIPANAQYHLIRNHPEIEFMFQDLFRRISYFAKTDTKVFGDGSRHYGCSRV
jgi:hypothetical protein